MKNKSAIAHALMYFVVASVAFLAGKCSRSDVAPAGDSSGGQAAVPDGVVVTYFFMGKKRCDACMALEKYTKQTVQKLSDRGIRYSFIDCDEAKNKHYIQELKLESKSVVVSVFKDGKRADWSVLDMGHAFGLVAEGKSEEYQKYLTAEVDALAASGEK